MKATIPENKPLPDPNFPKTQVFVGPSASGKTKAASDAALGIKSIFIDARHFNRRAPQYFFNQIQGNEELVIIDDVPEKHLKHILIHLMNGFLIIDKRGEKPFRFVWRHMIVTCEVKAFAFDNDPPIHQRAMLRRFEIITFPRL